MYKSVVIGCGAIHELHAYAIKENEHAELYGVCDIVKERADKAAEEFGGRTVYDMGDIITEDNRFGIKAFYSFEDVLKCNDVDVVHICTPHYLHAPMAIAAMKAGKHVFCEKPMAIKPEDAEEMIKVSEETGKKLGICFQNRYRNASAMAKKIIESGEIGKVIGAKANVFWNRGREYYASGAWRGKWDTEGGGVLINQSIHTLDLLNWLCGGAKELKAHVDTFELSDCIEVEDSAFVNIRFENGNALFTATNVYAKDTPIELDILCENGTMSIRDNLTVNYPDRTEIYYDAKAKGFGKTVWGITHKQIIDDFYDSLVNDRAFAVCGREGVNAIKLIDAIYTSDRENKYVEIK